MKRTWTCFAILLLLLPLSSSGQASLPRSITVLKSSSSTLQLPGNLALTATVAPAANAPGMPSGNVQFFTNTTSLIGTAPLTAIPSTQKFSSQPITSNQGYLPFGLFNLPSKTSKGSVVGLLDFGITDSGAYFPELTIYSGQGSSLFATSALYNMSDSNITSTYPGVDAFVVGDFNHDGSPDVLIHGYSSQTQANEYYVLPGNSDGTFNANSKISPDNSGLTCSCSNPTEMITVDDFNGDGYPDVAYAGSPYNSNGQVGVALNGGSKNPATFTTFTTAPIVPPIANSTAFVPESIAAGHFTASGHADLLVGGEFPSTVYTGALALFPGNGDGTFAAPVTFTTASNPVAIATGDLRQNGMTDVVVANSGFTDSTATVQIFFGDGAGNLAVSSTPTYCPLVIVGEGSETPTSLLLRDFNNDGFPDILGTGSYGSLCLMLNDGKGHFGNGIIIGESPQISSMTATGDFNSDGLADIIGLTSYGVDDSEFSTASIYLNSASSQAVLTTAPLTLPAGTDTLTATFPQNANFTASTSNQVPVTVNQTPGLITWAQPSAIEYGTPLGISQLNATSSTTGTITYSPPAGTVLPPGTNNVTATFVPTDSFDYTGATKTQVITVAAPTLTGISPTSANLGAGNTTITVTGQGFVNGATVHWNGTALATAWVSLNQLSAVIPPSLLTAKGTSAITVVDPNNVTVAGSATFTIIPQDAVAQASAEATVTAGENGSLTLTVNPYPVAITATVNLAFTPNPPNTVVDPTITFTNNATTTTFQIPANSTAPIAPITFSTGSTAGTIELTVTLNAGGADITPSTLVPVAVAVPTSPPVINSVTATRSGMTLTLEIRGLSSTRDMTQAVFHFTPATGQSLKTTDLTVDLTNVFATWYASDVSDQFGTTFLYTQPFALNSDATSVGSISVTLQNSNGTSSAATAQ